MSMLKDKRHKNVIKIILTDLAGILCLILVPLLGPLPGPGGTPLLLAGLGLLALNHDWADRWLHKVKVHSDSLRKIVFPKISWIEWLWDIFAVSLLIFGTYLSFVTEGNFWKAFSIVIMAGSTTVFVMNRDRITWLDKKVRPGSKKNR